MVRDIVASTATGYLNGPGIDEPLARGGSEFYWADALGSVLRLTDPGGSITIAYGYEPFGRASVTSGASTNSAQYTGRENDGTGLHYYRARYYHTDLQRFLGEDPIGFTSGDTNVYVYTGNSPVSYVDSLGLDRNKRGCDFGHIFATSFRQRVHVTNNFLFNPTATLVKGGLGLALGTGSIVARGFGTVAPLEAAIGAYSGGVANLTVGATLASGAFTFVVNAALSAAALEAGVLVGSAAGALGEAVGECALR